MVHHQFSFRSMTMRIILLIGIFILFGIGIWLSTDPFSPTILMNSHPYEFSTEKEWGSEIQESRIKKGGCLFISYPKTDCQETDEEIAAFIAHAKKQYLALAQNSSKKIPRLVIDYTTQKKEGYIALTLTFHLGEYKKDGSGKDSISEEQHLYLDQTGKILGIYDLLGEKKSKKLDYLLKKTNESTENLTAFIYTNEKITLDWGNKSKTIPMEEIQKLRLIDPEKPMIAITFDDGPGSLTKKFADLLAEFDGRGTFFVLGRNVKNYKVQLAYAHQQGHEIGSHTMRHKNLNKLSKKQIQKEVADADKAIAAAIGKKPALVRAPYGNSKAQVIKIIDRPVIHWNLDTNDWKTRDAKKIRNELLKGVSDGSIILMHEIYQSTYDGLALALTDLEKEGYQFVTVSELMKYRKIKPENKIYYSFPKK